MGIAANQARLMTLTARQNDLEYKAQQISAIKMRLSQTTSTLAQDYSKALNNYTKLNSAEQIAKQYIKTETRKKEGSDENETVEVSTANFIVNADGSFTLSKDGTVSAASLVQAVATALNVGTVTTANGYLTLQQGRYTTETEQISAQEKVYDMELTQVNTEHDAIKTEYDAIKSLVGDNVEKSFNVFG